MRGIDPDLLVATLAWLFAFGLIAATIGGMFR
jgi:hypothetical protein